MTKEICLSLIALIVFIGTPVCAMDDDTLNGLNIRLHTAIECISIEGARRILEEGAHPNYCSRFSSDSCAFGATNTALVHVLRNKFLTLCPALTIQFINLFLDFKADINSKVCGGISPLMWACLGAANFSYEHEMRTIMKSIKTDGSVIEHLITCGAHVNDQSVDCSEIQKPLRYMPFLGSTALCCAAAEDNCEAMDVLLRHGALIGVLDLQKQTPLHYAVQNNSLGAVRFILKQRRMVRQPLRNKFFVLMSAFHPRLGKRSPVSQIPCAIIQHIHSSLVDYVDIHQKSNYGITALDVAQENKNVKIIKELTKAIQE